MRGAIYYRRRIHYCFWNVADKTLFSPLTTSLNIRTSDYDSKIKKSSKSGRARIISIYFKGDVNSS